MKLFIEPPTWLGDAVMASGCIDRLINYYNPDEIILFGSYVSTELFKRYDKVSEIIIDDKKNRLKKIFTLPKSDVAISFRNHIFTKLTLFFRAKNYFYPKGVYTGHQVEKYSKFTNEIIKENKIYSPKLNFIPKKYQKSTIGINPGATYGSAKRWYPEEFAKVANELGKKYDIIIFGGPGEEEIAKNIEKNLTIKNYQNLCGKLSIKELAEYIGGLELFITNDSGPMHIAAAFKVKIVALFGPTKYNETSPYNTTYKIVTKNLDCAPCMKRECPLGHHKCMKLITADEVIKASKELL